ncbi:hypothetical protein Dimus_005432 [Dionaea muscipula]
MKRGRETEEQKSEILSAIEELSVVVRVKAKTPPEEAPGGGGDHGQAASSLYIPTRPFLCLCYLILQILDKIGPRLAVLRHDVSENIQRLEKSWEADPATYSSLVEILKSEAVEGNARKGDSSSRALLWLTRSLDLTAVLLQKLASDPGQSMEALVDDTYKITLKPWHGWISATAYKVALKLLPDKKCFTNLLLAKGQDFDALKNEIKTFNSLLAPFVEDIYAILVNFPLIIHMHVYSSFPSCIRAT